MLTSQSGKQTWRTAEADVDMATWQSGVGEQVAK
jgi:hypothetical protein